MLTPEPESCSWCGELSHQRFDIAYSDEACRLLLIDSEQFEFRLQGQGQFEERDRVIAQVFDQSLLGSSFACSERRHLPDQSAYLLDNLCLSDQLCYLLPSRGAPETVPAWAGGVLERSVVSGI